MISELAAQYDVHAKHRSNWMKQLPSPGNTGTRPGYYGLNKPYVHSGSEKVYAPLPGRFGG